MKLHKALFGALLVMANLSTQAQEVHNMVVQTNKVGAEIQPTMYGLFLRTLIMPQMEVFMPN